MTEEQGKKLITYVQELARQHNELEQRVAELERLFVNTPSGRKTKWEASQPVANG